MGDRLLMQVKGPADEFSPVIYCHWSGSDAGSFCDELRRRMEGRNRDISYTAARLVQIVTAGDPKGNMSFRVWNATAILTEKDSHGDAGIVLVDVSTDEMTFSCLGGYLSIDAETGLPTESHGE